MSLFLYLFHGQYSNPSLNPYVLVSAQATGMVHHYSAISISIPLQRQNFIPFLFLLQPTRNTFNPSYSLWHFISSMNVTGGETGGENISACLTLCPAVFPSGQINFLTCGTFHQTCPFLRRNNAITTTITTTT